MSEAVLGTLRAVIAMAVLVFGGAAFAAESPAPSPVQAEIAATADTWVDEARPGSAHGTDRTLVAEFKAGKGGTRILIGFHLTQIKGSHIESAQLQLVLTKSIGQASIQMATSGVTGAWSESTTWTDQPERTQTYDIKEVGAVAGPVVWDVTQLLRETLEARDSLEGIALSGPLVNATDYARTFGARESNKTPKLIVQYLPGQAVRPKPSPTAASVLTPTKAEPADQSPPGSTGIRIGLTLLGALAILAIASVIARKRAKPPFRH